MNLFKKVLMCGGVAVFLQVNECSMPSDAKTAQWQMYLEVPVVDKQFKARDLLEKDLGPEFDVSFGDGDSDTVIIGKSDSMSYTFTRELVALDTSILEKKLGAVTLQNTPEVDVSFSLTDNLADVPLDLALPSAMQLDQSKDQTVRGVQSVTFDESSPPLQITVTNGAAGADMKDVRVTLSSGGVTVGSVDVAAIGAKSSKVTPVNLAGKKIVTTITVGVRATVPAGSVVKTGDGLGVRFSLDNQVASDAVVVDSMVEYSDTVNGSFGLADGIMLDAIDIADARLHGEIQNPLSLQIGLVAVINDCWKIAYANSKNIESRKQLATATDSSAFGGKIFSDTLFTNRTQKNASFQIGLNNLRVFPAWDPDSQKSILEFTYIVTSVPDGRNVHFNKDDVMVFKLVPEKFPFIQIQGTFVDPVVEEFSSSQEVGFGWGSSIVDSLQKGFRFESAKMNLAFTPALPPKSSIDSIKMHIAINSNVNPTDSVIADKKLVNVAPDSQYLTSIELAPILNSWPDSIGFNTRVVLPGMTGLRLLNTKDKNGNYRNALTIDINVNWKLRIPFAWRVLDTIRMELDHSTIALGLDDLEWIDKLREKQIVLQLNARNNTNLNFILYAFGASEIYRNELDALPNTVPGKRSAGSYLGSHLFSIFGDDGLRLAPRGGQSAVKVTLDETGLRALLAKEDCVIRWFLCIPKSSPDAFTTGDYLDLKATAAVEGIGRTDSLLYWEE